MKFNGSVTINAPRSLVVDIFADAKNMPNYFDGFIKKDLVHGEEGQDGAQYKMYFAYGKRKMEMIETIVANQLPKQFEATYYHEHMDNTMTCKFTAIDEQTTRYDYEYEYTRINWIMPRLMAILFPGMYRKQGEKMIQQFKLYVEQQVSG